MVRVRVAVGIAHFVAAEVFGVTVPFFFRLSHYGV
jgi:hypothetical protein